MSTLFKKAKSEHIFVLVICLIIVVYFIYKFYKHLDSKGKSGHENYNSMPSQYSSTSNKNNSASQNNMYAAATPEMYDGTEQSLNPAPVQPGTQTSMPGLPTSCSKPNIQNPSELLPRDANSQWASLNPNGKGELSNISFLAAGALHGIDTVGSSLRNANLQVRSEPACPMQSVGPWNISTISHDFMRPALEIGSGPQ